jgi:hypothetical protein
VLQVVQVVCGRGRRRGGRMEERREDGGEEGATYVREKHVSDCARNHEKHFVPLSIYFGKVFLSSPSFHPILRPCSVAPSLLPLLQKFCRNSLYQGPSPSQVFILHQPPWSPHRLQLLFIAFSSPLQQE